MKYSYTYVVNELLKICRKKEIHTNLNRKTRIHLKQKQKSTIKTLENSNQYKCHGIGYPVERGRCDGQGTKELLRTGCVPFLNLGGGYLLKIAIFGYSLL